MSFPTRPIAFVLASTNHGTMIVNRNDYHMVNEREGYGVGFQLMAQSAFDPSEVGLLLALLDLRRHYYEDGVVAIDGGANIGVHTIEWARHMHGWGSVVAFEAQAPVYYALAGNVALNNCFNVRALHAALGKETGVLSIPRPDYTQAASFGSLELRQSANNEFIGQRVRYDADAMDMVRLMTIDSLGLSRIDVMKIDVEGMEAEVLEGAREAIARHKPIVLMEVIKSDREALDRILADHGYMRHYLGLNVLAVHQSDIIATHIEVQDGVFKLRPVES